jgi:hypothetical protein
VVLASREKGQPEETKEVSVLDTNAESLEKNEDSNTSGELGSLECGGQQDVGTPAQQL